MRDSKNGSPSQSLFIDNGTVLTKPEALDEFQLDEGREASVSNLLGETLCHEYQRPALTVQNGSEAFSGKTYNQKNSNNISPEPTLEAYRQSCKERDLNRFKRIGSSITKRTDEAVLDYWKPKNSYRSLHTSSHAPQPTSYNLSPDMAANELDISPTTRAQGRAPRNPDLFLDPPTPKYNFRDEYFQLEDEARQSRDKSSSHPGQPDYSMTPIPSPANPASVEEVAPDGGREPLYATRANVPRIDAGFPGYFG